MKISCLRSKVLSANADLIIVPVCGKKSKAKNNWLSAFSKHSAELLKSLNTEFDGQVKRVVQHYEYAPNAGKCLDINLMDSLLVLRLCGLPVEAFSSELAASLDDWRKLGAGAKKSASSHKAKKVNIHICGSLGTAQADVISAMSEGVSLADYSFSKYKEKKSTKKPNISFTFIGPKLALKSARFSIKTAIQAAEATKFARDLVNYPPSDLTPQHLVREARAIARKKGSRISCRVYNKAALTKLKAHSLLSVSRGSNSEPVLIHLSYRPPKTRKQPKRVVLVGKGVTFDSGGLSLKTGKGMEDMKCDMAGAACVLAVLKALSERRLQNEAIGHEVHVLIPAVENLVSASSVKPGDVVRAMNGKTIEILNTDAEGRLILADALSYSSKLNADITIDLATLTGSCVAALGSSYAGLFCDDEAMRNKLQELGRMAGERLWPMPLAKEYRPQLDSSLASLRNIGTGPPGAITAALFLKEFVPEKTTWAHIDIAGTAFGKSSADYYSKGGSGFGVRTMLSFLESL